MQPGLGEVTGKKRTPHKEMQRQAVSLRDARTRRADGQEGPLALSGFREVFAELIPGASPEGWVEVCGEVAEKGGRDVSPSDRPEGEVSSGGRLLPRVQVCVQLCLDPSSHLFMIRLPILSSPPFMVLRAGGAPSFRSYHSSHSLCPSCMIASQLRFQPEVRADDSRSFFWNISPASRDLTGSSGLMQKPRAQTPSPQTSLPLHTRSPDNNFNPEITPRPCPTLPMAFISFKINL